MSERNPVAGDVARLVEALPSMHAALGSSLAMHLTVVMLVCLPRTQEVWTGEPEVQSRALS